LSAQALRPRTLARDLTSLVSATDVENDRWRWREADGNPV